MPPKAQTLQTLSPKQKVGLKRIALMLSEKNPTITKHIFDLEDALTERIDKVEASIPDVQAIVDAVKIKKGEKGDDGDKGDKGDPGEDYILTGKDKEEIAKSIKVPIVEKVIEKREVIREIPIVTENIVKEIKEVEVLDEKLLPKYGEQIRDGLELITEEDDKLKISAIGHLREELDDLKKREARPRMFGGMSGVKSIIAGTGISVDESNLGYPVVSAASSFETVSKNITSSDGTLNYTGENLTSIVYGNGITKTLNYTGDNLTSVVLSGSTPSGIDLTKTLSYSGDNLTGVAYT